MATITTQLNTTFAVPAVGLFVVQASSGTAILERRQSSTAAWVEVARVHGTSVDVNNAILGMDWRLRAAVPGSSVVVQVDQ